VNLRYSVLCFFAIIIAVLLVFKNYETWTSPLEPSPEKGVSKKADPKPGGQPLGDQKDPKAAPSIASYIFIAEKNPFHPDRKEFPLPPVAGAPTGPPVKPPPVRPQVTLYGVTIGGAYQSASVSYPGRPLQKGERDVVTVKIGDRVGEYKLVKILEDRIGLEAQEDNFEVLLYDGRTPKKRVVAKTENKPAAVTSTVPGPPEPARPGGPPVPGAPVAPGVIAAPVPVPVTPAAIPNPSNPRARRFGRGSVPE
jgi:hypothetical protein